MGTIRAKQRAELSFETGGRVEAVLVDVGDHVKSGQILATLDLAPARWRLQKSEAERAAASAELREANTQLNLREPLVSEQIISPAAIETARTQSALAAAKARVADVATSAAQRDLLLARIEAPFEGEIVARSVQPHAEVGSGQVVLQLESAGQLEVVAMLPDWVADAVAHGQAASATVSAGPGKKASVPLALERVSAHVDNGSLVQVVFRVKPGSSLLRIGGVVELELPRRDGRAITIPSRALLPGLQTGKGEVFVLDEKQGFVHRRAVYLGVAAIGDGRIPVASGLVDGDVVVAAGASFLTDGQKAIRSPSETLLQDGPR